MPSDKDREEARREADEYFSTEPRYIDALIARLERLITRTRAEARAEVAYDSHVLYKTGDTDAPAQIKDANGDVCLGMCRNCGRVEAELSEVCDHRRVKAEALREAAGLRDSLRPVEPPSYCDFESYKAGWKDAAEVYQGAILSANPSPDEGGAQGDEPTEKGE